ncbi:MAG: MFS transporter [Desulfatiglandales bacterium]
MKWNKDSTLFNDPYKYRWLICGVLGIVYFFVCLHRISTTVIAQDLALEFDADATALGLMSSTYFYLYAAVQPPVGILSDSIGPRRVTTFFTFIAAAGAVLFAIAPNMTMAMVGRALIGIGAGGVFIPSVKTFSRWYREREFASVLGIFLAVGNSGNISASLPLTFFVLLIGWRTSFMAIGAVSFLLALVSWLIVRDIPEDKGWQPIETGENRLTASSEDMRGDISPQKRLGMVIRNPALWFLMLSMFFSGGPGLTFQGLWAVPFLMDVHGFGRLQAGGLLMVIPVGFSIGAPAFGILADRIALSRKYILLLSLAIGLVSWPIFFVTRGKIDSIYIIFIFLIMGMCGGGSLSLYMTITKELFPPWLNGTAMGLINPSAFFSAALFQPFTGFLMDAVGKSGSIYPREAYSLVLIVLFISSMIGFIFIIPLSERRREPLKDFLPKDHQS